ncbi:phosphate regulon transcriptional regulatory protein PhoB [bacterium BMS3Abin14]|nr:phosphate regulon transcriptional regulatory protein PhoB [bacterium BMS3Abin14]
MGKKILLVDDNDKARSINSSVLQQAGFEITEAENGVECIKAMQNLLPDLIILDLVMPIMDGYKVLQMIKTRQVTRDIPVIVLSGRGQPEEVEKALKLGASDFLVKMRTNPKALLEKVQAILEKPKSAMEVHKYRLAIKEKIYDAVKLATDFEFPVEYRCSRCGNPLLLELLPDYTHKEHWFTGHFVCSHCD